MVRKSLKWSQTLHLPYLVLHRTDVYLGRKRRATSMVFCNKCRTPVSQNKQISGNGSQTSARQEGSPVVKEAMDSVHWTHSKSYFMNRYQVSTVYD